ncbi:MAG: ribosome maturation factor RimP [Actinomycetota bacterium]
MASVQDRLWDRIDPYVAAEGVELDDIEIHGGGQIVRVTVDADEPIGVDVIAELSKGIGRLIEEDDPFTGSYTLEVSSPGLERKLNRANHYIKSIGRTVKVKTFGPVDGEKSHEGELLAADETAFMIDIDGTERKFQYDDVSSARTVFVWEKGARPGKDA